MSEPWFAHCLVLWVGWVVAAWLKVPGDAVGGHCSGEVVAVDDGVVSGAEQGGVVELSLS
jgi:hypothetical protein